MSIVFTAKRTVQVKNLGWLNRHAKECQKFMLQRYGTGGYLTAFGSTDIGIRWRYETAWMSYSLMEEWCYRRIFRHVEKSYASVRQNVP